MALQSTLPHKSTHAAGGADAITPADIGAASSDDLDSLDLQIFGEYGINSALNGEINTVSGRVGALEEDFLWLGGKENIVSRGDLDALTPEAIGAQPAGSYAADAHPHTAASTTVAGFMSATDKTKLDGVAAGATAYSHPTGDGNLHVLATGTTNNGKVLKAGATAGSLSWGTLTATDVGLGNLLPPSIRSINTAYTLQLSDASNTVSATSVLAITVPLNSTAAFPIGSQVLLLKTTASEVSIAAAAGVTLQAPGSASKIASQYGMAVLLKVATDSWILGGDII